MKFALPLICCVIFCSIGAAQSYKTVQKVVPLLEEQTFYLNSQTRIGGKPRNAIKIELPEHTVQWSYAFTTSKKESGGESIKLLKQVTDFVAKGLLNSNLIGITTNMAYQVVKPTGAGVVDIYLTDVTGQEQFFATSWNVYSFSKPEKTFDGSRENIKDGTILVNEVSNRSVYLCFNNPSSTEGVYVTLEAIAVVATQEYVDEWTPESKDKFFNECADVLRFQPEAAKVVCDCFKSKMITRYRPSAFEQLSQQEKIIQQQGFMEECLVQTGHEDLKSKVKVRALQEEIRGLELTKDYSALARRYRELLDLGEDKEDVYYNLSQNLLYIKQFDEVKILLTKALGKYPKETALWLNWAHYHLLAGNAGEAESIYQQYRGERVAKKLRWEDAVATDFQLFESLGIDSSNFAKIKTMLGF
ncbi:MAG: hypothetical protein IPJ74_15740 [Saprospiraceae bacterium]|nr:hypothetical protein [Saprospiraceae bacterium]